MKVLCSISILAFALKCWNCHSSINPGCDDPFQKVNKLNETMYADCLPTENVGSSFCFKLKGKFILNQYDTCMLLVSSHKMIISIYLLNFIQLLCFVLFHQKCALLSVDVNLASRDWKWHPQLLKLQANFLEIVPLTAAIMQWNTVQFPRWLSFQ